MTSQVVVILKICLYFKVRIAERRRDRKKNLFISWLCPQAAATARAGEKKNGAEGGGAREPGIAQALQGGPGFPRLVPAEAQGEGP